MRLGGVLLVGIGDRVRNTVRAVSAANEPPKHSRESRGSLVDAVEPRVREFPRMPATAVAERIGWDYSLTILKDRIRDISPGWS